MQYANNTLQSDSFDRSLTAEDTGAFFSAIWCGGLAIKKLIGQDIDHLNSLLGMIQTRNILIIIQRTFMAKKGNRQLIRLRNKLTGTFYISQKNRVNTTDKMAVKKFDNKTGKHELFEEEKVK